MNPHRVRMGTLLVTIVAIVNTSGARGEGDPSSANPLTAYEAVRLGNNRLRDGKPEAALEAYLQAEQIEPNAHEIAFAKGLAYYDLQEFDKARAAFREAATATDDKLADDALYSLGTCDHAEALASADQPQLAMSKLESAMARYYEVLDNQPDHEAARDASRKAAALWRQLKQQMQQQKEQQSSESQENDEQEDKQQQEQQQEQNQQEQDEQKQKQKQEQDQSQQQQQDSSEDQQQQQDQKDQQQQQQADDKQDEQQQQASEQKQEDVSREQAERKLREMMHAIRERKERRREPVDLVPVKPVDKDW